MLAKMISLQMLENGVGYGWKPEDSWHTVKEIGFLGWSSNPDFEHGKGAGFARS